jgi:hypothetical protein
LRVVVAAVLVVAADAVLVAHHLPKLGAHLITALARLNIINLARRSKTWRCGERGRKGRKERRNIRSSVWKFGTGNRKCRWRARVIPNGGVKWFTTSTSRDVGAVQSAPGVGGCGREIYAITTFPL